MHLWKLSVDIYIIHSFLKNILYMNIIQFSVKCKYNITDCTSKLSPISKNFVLQLTSLNSPTQWRKFSLFNLAIINTLQRTFNNKRKQFEQSTWIITTIYAQKVREHDWWWRRNLDSYFFLQTGKFKHTIMEAYIHIFGSIKQK